MGRVAAGVLERPLDTLAVVGEGEQIRERRERLGLSTRALAKESGVDRATIARLEEGGTVRGASTGAIVAALDRLEREMSGPYDADVAATGPGEVTFTLHGNFGVSVTVQGPVSNLDELRASAERLLAQMLTDRGDTPSDS